MKRYGLLGYPLGHSFSAAYFAEKFAAEGIEATYDNFERPSAEHLREWAATEGLSGFNVTIPHKQAVIAQLDALSAEAEAIGAVNVVRVSRTAEGVRLCGYNSDATGFAQSLRPLLRERHRRALVLGTGGASRAVVYALRQMGMAVQLVSRTHSERALSYAELTAEVMREHLLIVNCTPLGTAPAVDTCPPIPYGYLTSEHLLYDLVYNPSETRFLRQGREQGAATKNGRGMLVLQAEAAWAIWQTQEP